MAKSINVNESARVKLTEVGLARHKADHEEFLASLPAPRRARFPYRPPEVDAEGYSKFQIHNLMKLFGPMMFVGGRVPFIDLVFDEKDLKDHPDVQ